MQYTVFSIQYAECRMQYTVYSQSGIELQNNCTGLPLCTCSVSVKLEVEFYQTKQSDIRQSTADPLNAETSSKLTQVKLQLIFVAAATNTKYKYQIHKWLITLFCRQLWGLMNEKFWGLKILCLKITTIMYVYGQSSLPEDRLPTASKHCKTFQRGISFHSQMIPRGH